MVQDPNPTIRHPGPQQGPRAAETDTQTCTDAQMEPEEAAEQAAALAHQVARANVGDGAPAIGAPPTPADPTAQAEEQAAAEKAVGPARAIPQPAASVPAYTAPLPAPPPAARAPCLLPPLAPHHNQAPHHCPQAAEEAARQAEDMDTDEDSPGLLTDDEEEAPAPYRQPRLLDPFKAMNPITVAARRANASLLARGKTPDSKYNLSTCGVLSTHIASVGENGTLKDTLMIDGLASEYLPTVEAIKWFKKHASTTANAAALGAYDLLALTMNGTTGISNGAFLIMLDTKEATDMLVGQTQLEMPILELPPGTPEFQEGTPGRPNVYPYHGQLLISGYDARDFRLTVTSEDFIGADCPTANQHIIEVGRALATLDLPDLAAALEFDTLQTFKRLDCIPGFFDPITDYGCSQVTIQLQNEENIHTLTTNSYPDGAPPGTYDFLGKKLMRCDPIAPRPCSIPPHPALNQLPQHLHPQVHSSGCDRQDVGLGPRRQGQNEEHHPADAERHHVRRHCQEPLWLREAALPPHPDHDPLDPGRLRRQAGTPPRPPLPAGLRQHPPSLHRTQQPALWLCPIHPRTNAGQNPVRADPPGQRLQGHHHCVHCLDQNQHPPGGQGHSPRTHRPAGQQARRSSQARRPQRDPRDRQPPRRERPRRPRRPPRLQRWHQRPARRAQRVAPERDRLDVGLPQGQTQVAPWPPTLLLPPGALRAPAAAQVTSRNLNTQHPASLLPPTGALRAPAPATGNHVTTLNQAFPPLPPRALCAPTPVTSWDSYLLSPAFLFQPP